MSDRSRTLNLLIDLSHELGRRENDLVILAEGNTSARLSDETFIVKASGANLATIDASGLVECRFAPLLQLLDGPPLDDAAVEAALMDCRVDPAAKKPSVEAVFHAQLLTLPGIAFVGHTHPANVNAILCSNEIASFADERRFPDEIVCCGTHSAVVPYVDPGVLLAREIARVTNEFVTREGAPPRVILLANHGMIAPAGSPAGVIAATLMAQKAAGIFVGARSLGGAVAMPRQQVARIADRPDEHYRRRQLKM